MLPGEPRNLNYAAKIADSLASREVVGDHRLPGSRKFSSLLPGHAFQSHMSLKATHTSNIGLELKREAPLAGTPKKGLFPLSATGLIIEHSNMRDRVLIPLLDRASADRGLSSRHLVLMLQLDRPPMSTRRICKRTWARPSVDPVSSGRQPVLPKHSSNSRG